MNLRETCLCKKRRSEAQTITQRLKSRAKSADEPWQLAAVQSRNVGVGVLARGVRLVRLEKRGGLGEIHSVSAIVHRLRVEHFGDAVVEDACRERRRICRGADFHVAAIGLAGLDLVGFSLALLRFHRFDRRIRRALSWSAVENTKLMRNLRRRRYRLRLSGGCGLRLVCHRGGGLKGKRRRCDGLAEQRRTEVRKILRTGGKIRVFTLTLVLVLILILCNTDSGDC